MNLVSVIIPVYNTGKYLERCIDSLLCNKNKPEILIIDDHSTDNSLEIAYKLSKKSEVIKVISLSQNKGVSNARNIGIKEATGEFLMFADSDDWYEPNAIDILLSAAKNNHADFVMANYYISYENKKIKVDTTSYFSKNKITKKEVISHMSLTSCSKLIKKDLFLNKHIFYPLDVKRCEELTVIPILAFYAKKPMVIDETLYNYYQRPNSASNKKETDISYFDITFNRFVDIIYNSKYAEEIEFRAIEHLLYSKTLVMLKSNFKMRDIKKHIKEFKNKYKNYNKNKYLPNFNIIKRMFIITLNTKCLVFHKIFAFIHSKITG